MRKFAALLFCLASLLVACGPEKAPEGEPTIEEKYLPPIELYITSCESSDSSLCDKSACLPTDDLHCSIEDFYFTKNGNVVQRIYCAGEDEAVWIVGSYRVIDSGIICQMDKAYHLNLKAKGDSINYNSGKFYELNSKEPFLLRKSDCPGIAYTQRFAPVARAKREEESGATAPYGRIYYENQATQRQMLTELQKVKALKKL